MVEKSDSPLVSIIVPTFNRYNYLLETVDSILRQSYMNFELIIISDKSTDATFLLKNKIQDKRCCFYELDQKSSGPAAVRNFGILKSRGLLIAFCDDDDLWDIRKLEMQVDILIQRPEISIISTNVTYFGTRSFSYLGVIKNLLNNLTIINAKYLLVLYNCIVISSSVVRKHVFDTIGYFKEDIEYQGHEDSDLWLRACSTYNVHIITKILTYYRIHQNQLSTLNNKKYKRKSFELMKNHYPEFSFWQKVLFILRISIYYMIKI